DTEVIFGNVSELGTPRTFAHGPDVGRGRLEFFADFDVTAIVERDPRNVEPGPGRVRRAAHRYQKVATVNRPLPVGRAHDHADPLARATPDSEDRCQQENVDPFALEKLEK